MTADRKTRRRFLADLLFAGGAVTAASVLGYVATHVKPKPDMQPVGALQPSRPQPSPAVAPTPVESPNSCEMQPEGDMVAPTPTRALTPPGAPPPPSPRIRQDLAPEGGARPTGRDR